MPIGNSACPSLAAPPPMIAVLWSLSLCHLLNDTMQSLLVALFPLFHEELSLSFTEIGLLAFAFNGTASVLQPLVGWANDRKPRPRMLGLAMGFPAVGLLLLAGAHHFWLLLAASVLVGIGSSVFHPESARVARMASGGRHGFAQSLFQVGGNTGQAIGPLMAALVVLPLGQWSVGLFSLAAALAMAVLWRVAGWVVREGAAARKRPASTHPITLPRSKLALAIAVLVGLMISKYLYMTALQSFYALYLIEAFGVSVQGAQLHLFVFLAAVALGTFLGGPIGDRIGRRAVIWLSILGALPFTLALPHAGLAWTPVFAAAAGFIMASAGSAIIVFAQELIPGRIGMVSGLFFGLAFGVGGIGAAVFGVLADAWGIRAVYLLCSVLPVLGLLTAFLPRARQFEAATSPG